ncbi:S66 peptidase family protein [Aphanothece sacrum]|uniref:Peptidase n=1 Tax=Aphanothece sacrum FPU1 TaxID=1920663 RepID=A0A401IKB4_APHSA|nr:LD-carboxypeptidase [Aphanothece sacrum]GBF81666.1 peptidase [Aphanothece sacrum FPU1]GBF84075.1 peptidase [Aphanothece sacrum FPU3]
MSSWKIPPFLTPGDRVQVIAPSGALKEFSALEEGLEIWRSRGYQVELGSNWQTVYGYLAGTDSQRRQALLEAWENPDCKAILCTRGGYGSARLFEHWDWPSICKISPKWVIGFSDITGLLWRLATVGMSGLHAPVLTTLSAEPAWSIDRLFDCLEGRFLAPLQGQGWGGGQTTGWLLPANLTVATHLLGTPVQPALDGAILALEDVGEAPYRIDRLLTQWRLMGAFNGVRGVALGRFSRCQVPSGSSGWTVEEVLRDRLGDLNIPIVSELPFGHDGVNAVLPLRIQVRLDGDQGILEFVR